MSIPNLSDKAKNQMLKNVSSKLGMTPQELEDALKSGKLDAAMKGMSQEDTAKLLNALSNPALTQKILSTPQAQEIINKLKS